MNWSGDAYGISSLITNNEANDFPFRIADTRIKPKNDRGNSPTDLEQAAVGSRKTGPRRRGRNLGARRPPHEYMIHRLREPPAHTPQEHFRLHPHHHRSPESILSPPVLPWTCSSCWSVPPTQQPEIDSFPAAQGGKRHVAVAECGSSPTTHILEVQFPVPWWPLIWAPHLITRGDISTCSTN